MKSKFKSNFFLSILLLPVTVFAMDPLAQLQEELTALQGSLTQLSQSLIQLSKPSAPQPAPAYPKKRLGNFGGWSIAKELFDYILQILPEGKIILEFGSGWASGELSNHYTVYSIEHDKKWLNKYNTNYIYAPIKSNWYDIDVLKEKLPQEYDLILVDGPPGAIGRGGFYTFADFFNLNVPIIFDDVHRTAELKLMMQFSKKLNREPKVTEAANKKFGVLLPKKD